jgi:hypothetical protein
VQGGARGTVAANELGAQEAEQVALLDAAVHGKLGRHDARQVDQVVSAIESCASHTNSNRSEGQPRDQPRLALAGW